MRYVLVFVTLTLVVGCSSIQQVSSGISAVNNVIGSGADVIRAIGGVRGQPSPATSFGSATGAVFSGTLISSKLSLARSFVDRASRDGNLAGSTELLSARQNLQNAEFYQSQLEMHQGSVYTDQSLNSYRSRVNSSIQGLKQDLVNLRNRYGEVHGISQVIDSLR